MVLQLKITWQPTKPLPHRPPSVRTWHLELQIRRMVTLEQKANQGFHWTVFGNCFSLLHLLSAVSIIAAPFKSTSSFTNWRPTQLQERSVERIFWCLKIVLTHSPVGLSNRTVCWGNVLFSQHRQHCIFKEGKIHGLTLDDEWRDVLRQTELEIKWQNHQNNESNV